MVSSVSGSSNYSTALYILKSGSNAPGPGTFGEDTGAMANNMADSAINKALMDSFAAKYGSNGADGWNAPDMTFVSAKLTGGGQVYFGAKHVEIHGGDKTDWMQAGDYSVLDGGEGDDFVNSQNYGKSYGGEGNDRVYSGEHGLSEGGVGDDLVVSGEFGVARGGEGNDGVAAAQFGEAYGEEGDDTITLYGGDEQYSPGGAYGNGGVGNDVFYLNGSANTAVGGEGDDVFDLTKAKNSIIKYEKGDGQDTIVLGDAYHANKRNIIPVDPVNNELQLGRWLDSTNTRFSVEDNELTISFAGDDADKITVEFNDRATFTVAFDDGTKVNFAQTASGEVVKMSGNQAAQSKAYAEF